MTTEFGRGGFQIKLCGFFSHLSGNVLIVVTDICAWDVSMATIFSQACFPKFFLV